MDEHVTEGGDSPSVSSIDLLMLTRAYNRKEITFEEWLLLTKEWAEAMQRGYGNAGDNRGPIKAQER